MPTENTASEKASTPVDLDIVSSWPVMILEEVTPLLQVVMDEKEADLQYALSGDRWFKPSPPAPATKSAHQIINREMAGKWIRVFHATRLLDFDAVRREGLQPLNLKRQIEAMKAGLVATGRFSTCSEVETLLANVDLESDLLDGREGQVWATPLRRLLHDGGCEVFFKHWGGEAMQRLAEMASPDLVKGIQSLGTAAVVTFDIPAFGCCVNSG